MSRVVVIASQKSPEFLSPKIARFIFLLQFPGLGNAEFVSASKANTAHAQQQGQQQQGQAQQGVPPGLKSGAVLYGDCEELNRVVVLTLARAISVHGLEQQSAQWVKETLAAVNARTPLEWPSHTLEHFPTIFQEFYSKVIHDSVYRYNCAWQR